MKRLTLFIIICLVIACGCDYESMTAPEQQSGEATMPPEIRKAVEMLNYWDDDKDMERRAAAIKLGVEMHPAAVKAVNTHLISDPDPKVRAACAWAAGRIQDNRSKPLLINALSDRDELVRREAALALASLRMAKEAGLPDNLFTNQGMGKKTEGKTWYVDASVGDDGKSGSEASPFKTITKGVSMLRAGKGDRLLVTSGAQKMPFREKIMISAEQAGTAANPTVLAAWPGKSRPVIYASKSLPAIKSGKDLYTETFVDKPQCVFLIGKNKTAILDGVKSLEELDHGKFFHNKEEGQLLILPPAQGFEGAKVEVGIFDDGIHVEKADYIHISGFEVAFAQDTGIDFSGSYHGVVSDCIVHDCDRHGIFFYYSAFGLVKNCEVSNCRYQGISIRSSSHSFVVDCNVHDNPLDGVLFLYDTDGAVVASSTISNNGRAVGFITGSNFGRVLSSKLSGNKRDVTFDPDCNGVYLPEPAK